MGGMYGRKIRLRQSDWFENEDEDFCPFLVLEYRPNETKLEMCKNVTCEI